MLLKNWLLIIILISLHAISSWAQYSQLEWLAINKALKLYGLEIENNPQRKIVGKIYVYTQDPFISEDGSWLDFLNKVHATTKSSLIENSLLISEGMVYDDFLQRQSEALLREYYLRSLVIVTTVKNKDLPETKVDLLVITRDIWSLRLESDFQVTGDTINSIYLGLGEHNLAGYNKEISAQFRLQQLTFDLGAKYYDPRLFGSRHRLRINPLVLLYKDNGSYAGFKTELEFEMPLYTIDREWSYYFYAYAEKRPYAEFIGNQIRIFKYENEAIERKYDLFYVDAEARITRSFGDVYKNNLHFGYALNISRPAFLGELTNSLEAQQAFIEDVMPRNELESLIRLGHQFFVNKFAKIYDYQNYQLAEEYRLGLSFSLYFDFASHPILFSDYSFIRPNYKLGYVSNYYADGLLSLQLTGANRFNGNLTDNNYSARITFVSPKIVNFFRIVADSLYKVQLNPRFSTNYLIGGNNAIRGYLSNLYLGDNVFKTNLEFRSRSFNIYIAHLGFVVFYDTGQAFTDYNDFNPSHSLGIGLRVLLPQVNKQVFRIDYGFPVSEPITNYWYGLSFGIQQFF